MKRVNGEIILEPGESEQQVLRYIFIGERLKKEGAKNVLDAACMHGYGSAILADYVEKVTANDLDSGSIEQAKRVYKGRNINFFVGDCTKTNFADNEFDAAVGLEIIEHLTEEQQHRFLKELSRVVKPHGLIAISTPDKFVGKPKRFVQDDHVRELTKPQLEGMMNQYFDSLEMYGQFVLSKSPARVMFIKRTFLGVAKRGFRSKMGKMLGTDTFFDYDIRQLGNKQTAAALCFLAYNKK